MNNDQRQVEAWRIEFEKKMAETYSHRSLEKENGHYTDREVFYWFLGFCLAKRHQPVIELPEENPMIFQVTGYEKYDLHDAITAAGYSYKVK